ncbi:hypothetical protein GQX74_008037 [Glossina fuscipes]|nr:hypothetical protein GQX74_008037 [Glossina fuscipes]
MQKFTIREKVMRIERDRDKVVVFMTTFNRNTVTFTLLPCPPLLLEVLLCLAWAVLSRRLSRALKLLETATLALVSLAESTLELPRRRPHLLARVLRADGGPDEGDGEGVGEGAAAVVKMRESSVNVNLAGNCFPHKNICLCHGVKNNLTTN